MTSLILDFLYGLFIANVVSVPFTIYKFFTGIRKKDVTKLKRGFVVLDSGKSPTATASIEVGVLLRVTQLEVSPKPKIRLNVIQTLGSDVFDTSYIVKKTENKPITKEHLALNPLKVYKEIRSPFTPFSLLKVPLGEYLLSGPYKTFQDLVDIAGKNYIHTTTVFKDINENKSVVLAELQVDKDSIRRISKELVYNPVADFEKKVYLLVKIL